MRDSHIDFSKWEGDESVDASHLATCEECRRNWELFRFVRFQTEAKPGIDPPPFFSARVAHLTRGEKPSFLLLLERVARGMAVVFMTLMVLTVMLLFHLEREAGLDVHSEALFESPPEVLPSLENVVNSLKEPLEEETRVDEP